MTDPMPQQPSMPPTTTSQQDLVTHGQRRINLIWETTQSAIAIAVTLATIYVALKGIEAASLNNTFFLVIGFYFGRTNHQRVGGVPADSFR